MVVDEIKCDFLDRPMLGRTALTFERLAWFVLVGLAVLTRLLNLGIRAMSHDESMHAYYSYLLHDSGAYQHDPALHGPLLFHLNALVYFLAGDNDFTARVIPALCGIVLLAGLYAFRGYLGRWGALAGALMVLISPSLLFYSRYIVIDVPLVLTSLAWSYGAFRYLRERNRCWLHLVVISMALSTSAKENAFIFGALLGGFLVAWAVIRKLARRTSYREQAAADLAILMFTLILPFLAPVLHLLLGWGNAVFAVQKGPSRSLWLILLLLVAAVACARFWFGRSGAKPAEIGALDFGLWARFMALFWLIQIALFTTFFSNVRSGFFSGVVGSLSYWIEQHGVRRGGAPWFYYLILGSLYEFLPILLAVCGIVFLLYLFSSRKQRDLLASTLEESSADNASPTTQSRVGGERILFGFFALWWTMGSWLVYSFAGERMPWLLVHITFPTILLGSWWIGWIADSVAWKKTRWAGTIWLIPALPVLTLAAATLFMVRPFTGRTLEAAGLTLRWLTALFLFLALLAFIRRSWRRQGAAAVGRSLLVGAAALLVLMTCRFSGMLNYRDYDLATEPLVYAHATPDIKLSLSEIEAARNRIADQESLLVCYDDDSTWPFTWYFRHLQGVRFYGKEADAAIATSPVVIVGPKNSAKVSTILGTDYVKRTRRLIWWPNEDYYDLSLRGAWNTLINEEKRRDLWQVVFHRRYPNTSFRDWPRRHEFEMYLRKDVADRIWGLGLPGGQESVSIGAFSECMPELVPPFVDVFDDTYEGKPLQFPRNLAISPGRTLIIADTGNDRIVVLSPNGRMLRSIGRRCRLEQGTAGGCTDADGTGPLQVGDGEFLEPWGVAVAPGGRIFVADTWNSRIQAFESNGRFLWKWGVFGSAVGDAGDPRLLFGPRGLAVSSGRELLVTDTGNKRILRFQEDGKFLGQGGSAGNTSGRFDEPVGIAIDSRSGDILVADSWNRRIQRFSGSLAFLKEIKVPGWASHGADSKPFLTVDKRGNIVASDPDESRIMIFNPQGKLIYTIRDLGDRYGRLNHPAGVAADPLDDALWIADSGNNRVVRLRWTEINPKETIAR